MTRWLLVTTSTPGSRSTLRVWAWRRLRGLGAHYVQQSVCILPDTPETTRAVGRILDRLDREGGHGDVLKIQITDSAQEAGLIAAFQAERSDEYQEVVDRTREFHTELEYERTRGRVTYTEFEESDADLRRHRRWLHAIQLRDYFHAPGRVEAIAAVDECAHALEEFAADALHSEQAKVAGEQERSVPELRVVDQ